VGLIALFVEGFLVNERLLDSVRTIENHIEHQAHYVEADPHHEVCSLNPGRTTKADRCVGGTNGGVLFEEEGGLRSVYRRQDL